MVPFNLIHDSNFISENKITLVFGCGKETYPEGKKSFDPGRCFKPQHVSMTDSDPFSVLHQTVSDGEIDRAMVSAVGGFEPRDGGPTLSKVSRQARPRRWPSNFK